MVAPSHMRLHLKLSGVTDFSLYASTNLNICGHRWLGATTGDDGIMEACVLQTEQTWGQRPYISVPPAHANKHTHT